ncbi:major facilitator superfamily domain-containing protein [Apiospora rasikravindrae]|uniref:Major facilitator superfamily domain-containing protein n=1 Tax=Apiospora rasikravindrae TaxID=990691 RepID=A0ABR1U7T0_9PEZI
MVTSTPPAGDSEKTVAPTTVLEQQQQLHPVIPLLEAPNEFQPEYVTGIRLALVITSAIVACFLMLVDTMVISTAIPRITDEFRSLPDVGWYAGVYQFGIAAPQPLIGKIYTHFKTKWTFLFFFLLFELGSVLCGAAINSPMLIVGRVIAGLGAAGIINSAITIVSSCAPLGKRPALLGLVMGIQQLGLVVGPLIGGAFTTYSTWRWSFYINLPIGSITVLLTIILRIPEQTPKRTPFQVLPQLHHHLDLIGFALFAPAVIQLLLALQYGWNQYAWNSSQVIGLFCGDGALLPAAMIRRRTVWSAAMFNPFQMVGIYGLFYYLPIYLQSVYNASAIMSGVYVIPFIVPQLLAAGMSGGVLQKTGYVIPVAVFSLVLSSIGAGLMSTLQANSSVGGWVGFQILAGVGSGAALQLGLISIQSVTSGEELSSGMAFMVFTQSLFPAIVLPLCNVVLVSSLKTQLPIHAPGLDVAAVIEAGATSFRKVVDAEDLVGVITAYAQSVDRVFYLNATMIVASGLFIWGIGWYDIRKQAGVHTSAERERAGTEHTKSG